MNSESGIVDGESGIVNGERVGYRFVWLSGASSEPAMPIILRCALHTLTTVTAG